LPGANHTLRDDPIGDSPERQQERQQQRVNREREQEIGQVHLSWFSRRAGARQGSERSAQGVQIERRSTPSGCCA